MASQTLIVRSVLVVINVLPSPAKATVVTDPECSRSDAAILRFAKSQTTTSPVQYPTMRYCPSAENAAEMGGMPPPNPPDRIGGSSFISGNCQTRRWSPIGKTSAAFTTKNQLSGEKATAFRPCQRESGAPGESPIGFQVCVSHSRQPPRVPVRSHRPLGENRHPRVESGSDRTSCQVCVSQSVTPESCPLARSLASGEKDK